MDTKDLEIKILKREVKFYKELNGKQGKTIKGYEELTAKFFKEWTPKTELKK